MTMRLADMKHDYSNCNQEFIELLNNDTSHRGERLGTTTYDADTDAGIASAEFIQLMDVLSSKVEIFFC